MLKMERLSGSQSDEAGSICRVSILVFRIAARQNRSGRMGLEGSGIHLQSHTSANPEDFTGQTGFLHSQAAVRVRLLLSSSHVHLDSNAAACFSELFMNSSLNIHM